MKRLRFLASTNDDTLSEKEDPLRPVLYVDIGSVDSTSGITEMEELVFEDAPSRARRLVRDGDTIISTVRTYLRAIAPVRAPRPEMVVSTGFAVIRPRALDSGFASWALREQRNVEEIVARSTGVSYPAISALQIGDLPIPFPSLSEQRSISEFLDRETERIDTLVAKKRLLIERLQEYRTALITRTVTRGLPPEEASAAGLDPSPRLKPSGVEWLGDVPEHWELSPLKVFSRCRSGQALSSCDVQSEPLEGRNIPVFGGNGLMGFTDRITCKGGVLAIGRVGALCGNIHVIERPAWITDNALALSVQSESVSLKYLAGVLEARSLNDLANKTAQPLITGSQILNEHILLPPLSEQTIIVEYLSTASKDLVSAIARIRRQIELIQEYRTALVTAAVTGKIDLRWSSPEELLSVG